MTTREHLLESLTKSMNCRSWRRMDPLRYFSTGDTASPMIRMSMTRSVNPPRTVWSCIQTTENILLGKTDHAKYWPGLCVPSTFTNKSSLEANIAMWFLSKNSLSRTVIFLHKHFYRRIKKIEQRSSFQHFICRHSKNLVIFIGFRIFHKQSRVWLSGLPLVLDVLSIIIL